MSSNFTGLVSNGVPIFGNGIPATKGRVFFVDYGNGSDSYDGLDITRPFKTVAVALGQCTTNNYDVICLIGSSTHTLTAMLDVSINRVAIIGLDNSPGRRYGQRQKVSLGVTTAATDIATIKNTGVGNVYMNIKFMNANTVDEGLYCVADGGEYAQWLNCEMYKSTDLDEDGAAELLCNADSAEYINCTIGSNVDAVTATGARPCVLLSRETLTGKVCRDTSFRNCLFWRKAGAVGNFFVYGSGATDVERMLLFENPIFFNTKLAASTPAQTIGMGASQTEGYVLVTNPALVGSATSLSTTAGVFAIGPDPSGAAATMGISIQCS